MTLLDKLLLATVLAQVGLTFAVLFWLGRARLPLIARGEVKVGDIALDASGRPLKSQQVANNFNNQFQLPVLFYVAALLLLLQLGSDLPSVILAAIFVASRVVHSVIHGTSNAVVPRFTAYLVGVWTLVALWVWLAVKALLLAPVL